MLSSGFTIGYLLGFTLHKALSHILSNLILIVTVWGKYHAAHLSDKKTKSQGS